MSLCTRPAPSPARHGLAITRPRPEQVGQVRSTMKKPCWARSLPAPLHDGQVCGSLPGSEPRPSHASQAMVVGMVTVAFLPAKASSSAISRL